MKARLTITLDEGLLAQVDRCVGRSARFASRSAVIEEAVRRWTRAGYEAAIREYYRGKSDRERREDDAWTELGATELAATFARDAPPQPRRRGRRR